MPAASAIIESMADGAEATALDDRPSGVSLRADSAPRLEALVHAHFDLVWRSVRRFGVREADADDAAQEVFLVAARRIDAIEAGAERSFLIGTALRVASTRRRSARRRPEVLNDRADETQDKTPDPEHLTQRLHARRLLDEILDEMATDQRAVFVLFELEELSAPEIADILALPVGTVASRLRRARESFRAASSRWRARANLAKGSSK